MKERFHQTKLPDPNNHDPHPRLLPGGKGIHAGYCFTALFPDGCHDIAPEIAWEVTGPQNAQAGDEGPCFT